jgi:cytochrome c oxidase assembly factor CtaG/putative copper export protein
MLRVRAQVSDHRDAHASVASGWGGVVVPALGLAAVVGVGLVVGLGGDGLGGLGLPDAGLLTTAGLALMRVLTDCAAVVTVGSLLLAAFLVPPQPSGRLDTGGNAAVRTAGLAALGWALAAILLIPLSAADALGRPVTEVLDLPLLASLVMRLSALRAWGLTAGMAVLICGLCWRTRCWAAVLWIFALSLLGLTPVVLLTGHSTAGGDHDFAIDSLLYHVIAAALWVGGLIALLAHLTRQSDHAGLATARFSRLALVCWLVMAVSGVINALIRLAPDRLLTSYGLLVVGKLAALLVLGLIGALHRRNAVPAVVQRGDRSALLRWGSVEVLLMCATIGLAVALSRTAPPGGLATRPSHLAMLLGYDLTGPPTAARLVTAWRPDLVLGPAALVLAGAYLAGVHRLARRGQAWSPGRTTAWLAGCAVILIATSSGIGRYSMAMFSAHLGACLLLSTLAPILLALGSPLTLALDALTPAAPGHPPAPREWLVALTQCWVVRMATHPAMALGMYLASFWVRYATGLFDAIAASHAAHLAMNIDALLMGYPFYWIIVGPDPSPHQLTAAGKLGLLSAALPSQALFGIFLTHSATVIAGNFYRSLALPFLPDLLTDQHHTAAIIWALGQIPIMVILIALMTQRLLINPTKTRRFSEKSQQTTRR